MTQRIDRRPLSSSGIARRERQVSPTRIVAHRFGLVGHPSAGPAQIIRTPPFGPSVKVRGTGVTGVSSANRKRCRARRLPSTIFIS
jgi:hypothetical protein